MNIVVCIKQVPDNNIIEYDYIEGSIDATDLVFVANPYDIFALIHALDIKDRVKDSLVTVISIGSTSVKKILRDCLALGADKAILVANQDSDNLDSYIVGSMLATIIGRLQYDLEGLVSRIERRVQDVHLPITVAVMGCAVNGPGEARHADVGVAGGNGRGAVFRGGQVVRTCDEADLEKVLMEEVDRLLVERKKKSVASSQNSE